MNAWSEFETEFAKELGLERVPGSGNHWSRKMDVDGRGLRFSLKYTSDMGIHIYDDTIRENIEACEGLGGSGDIPMWAFRRGPYPDVDLVMMRKDDFIRLFGEEVKLFTPARAKLDARRKRASTPALLRDQDED